METRHAESDAPVMTASRRPPVKVVADDGVRAAIRERGGSLYLWTHVHGVCEGRITFLDVATEPPAGVGRPFERLEAGDVDVYLSIGSLLWPRSIELELHGRKKQIRAFWNGQATVG